jgi:hypothetical protein
MVAGMGFEPTLEGYEPPLVDPAILKRASIRLRSGLRDLQDRVSMLRVLAKLVPAEGVAPSLTAF